MDKALSFFIVAILFLMMMTQLSLVDKVFNQTIDSDIEYIVGG